MPASSSTRIRSLTRIAIMIALYVVLAAFVSIKAGNLRITFASLPVIFTSVMFGPIPGMLVAGIGEFLNQLLGYGLTPTTVLWLLPPVTRALLIALGCKLLTKNETLPENKPIAYTICLIAAALVTTAFNTLIIYLDAVIMGYYTYAYVFGSVVIRFVTGMVTAVIMSAISLILLKALRNRI